jgi:O-Antigen ligase
MRRSLSVELLLPCVAGAIVGAAAVASTRIGIVALIGLALATRPRLMLALPALAVAVIIALPFNIALAGTRIELLWVVAIFVLFSSWLANVPRLAVLAFAAPALILIGNVNLTASASNDYLDWVLLFVVAVGVAAADPGQRRLITDWGIPIALVLAAGIGVLQIVHAAPGTIDHYFPWGQDVVDKSSGEAVNRVRGTFQGENNFGFFLVVSWPFLISRSLRRSVPRSLAIGANLLVVAALVGTYSRSNWVAGGLDLVLVAALALGPRRRWVLLLAAPIAAAFALAVFTGDGPEAQSVVTTRATAALNSNSPADRTRLQTWHEVTHAIGQQPLTGYGPEELYAAFMATTGADVDHSHNLYLQVTLEYGLLGLALLAVPFALALWRPESQEAWIAMIAILVTGMVDYFFWSPQSAALAGLVLGLAFPSRWLLAGRYDGGGEADPPTWRRGGRTERQPAIADGLAMTHG